ncbi:hypothetical protein LTR36_009757 [Oleoguttula mirabilis]|uniref:Glycerate dehydrogenase n=1 Tax=Oleoguttula mirabilis TaxID=1507867 RepID=A0AAV9J593_9PEZI|nr:hypothetical protein LTR36_009757 [Oleoguttula mirabilis]
MGSTGESAGEFHLTIVALEAAFCAIPTFSLPKPYTYTLQSYPETSNEQVASRIGAATVLLITTLPLTAEHLAPQCTPHLRMIAIMASGTDHVDLAACRKRGIQVCNASHANVPAVSNHAIGMYFAARRRFGLTGRALRAGEWVKDGTACMHLMGDADGVMPSTCDEEVMGLLGYGAIGKRIAEMARLLGMRVLVGERKGATRIREGRTAFEDVLKQSSVLVLILPRTPESLGLISAAELHTMSRHAILVNVSRGGIVDEPALVQALREGTIAGAAVDVFEEEPAAATNSVLLTPEASALNLTCTPHLAWVASATTKLLQRITRENVEAWCAGRSTNVVV